MANADTTKAMAEETVKIKGSSARPGAAVHS
jgi:hypothetical protein